MSRNLRVSIGILIIVLVAAIFLLNRYRLQSSAPPPQADLDPSSDVATVERVPEQPSVEEKSLRIRSVAGVIDLSTAHPYKNQPASFLPMPPIVPNDHGIYYVQFDRPITGEMKQQLTDAGAELLEYIPDLAFVARIRHRDVPAISAVEEVAAVGLKAPAMRVGPHVWNALENQRDGAPIALRVVGYINRPLNGAQLQAAGYPITYQEINGCRPVRMKTRIGELRRFLPALAARNDVAWIQVDFKPSLFSPPELGTMDIGPGLYNDIAARILQDGGTGTPVWDVGITGVGQRVCVTDSGCDEDHGMFYDTVNGLVGIDILNISQRKIIAYYDMHGTVASTGYDHATTSFHGTHVCGTVAGYFHASSPGSNNYKGIAYGAKLVVNDIATETGALVFGTGGVTGILTNGTGAGAFISSNSWGSTPANYQDYYDSRSRTLDLAVNDNENLLIVFAAGNSGIQPGGSISFEANAKNVLVVGATGDGSNTVAGNDHRANFSSNGPCPDGRYRPHVMAPGYSVYSAAGDEATFDSMDPENDHNHGLKYMAGTSMATPAVSGAAALIRQYFVDDLYPKGSVALPSASLLKAMLINSGKDMVGGKNGSSGNLLTNIPNNEQGWGRVQLDRVLEYTGGSRDLYVVDNRTGLNTNGSETLWIIASPGQPFRATLVWSDRAAAAGANPARVNDLNLTVTAPDGMVYRGNNFSGGLTVTGGSADSVNTEECVYLNVASEAGYKVTVSGANVPYGPQTYSLVLTGTLAFAPKIDVLGNNVSIPAGSTGTSTANHTNFGPVDVSGGTQSRTYTIKNIGSDDLTLSGLSKSGDHAVDFTITSPPVMPVTLSAGTSISFTVVFEPSDLGTRNAELSVISNDADTGTYTFAIAGTGDQPRISVYGNGYLIPNDVSILPSSTNHTDFGLVRIDRTKTITYTIYNPGSLPLSLNIVDPAVTLTGDTGVFAVVSNPAATLAAEEATSFQVRFSPDEKDTYYAAVVSIVSDATDDSPYIFTISGIGQQVPVYYPVSSGSSGCSFAASGGAYGYGFYLILLLPLGVARIFRRR